MSDLDPIEAVKAAAMRLAVDPNALTACGLDVAIPVPVFRCQFGRNSFPLITRHRYDAILPILAERWGLEVTGSIDGEIVLSRPREVA